MRKPYRSDPKCLNINIMAHSVYIFPCYSVNGPDGMRFLFTIKLIFFPSRPLSDLGTFSKLDFNVECLVIQMKCVML